MPKLNFLKTELNVSGAKIDEAEWTAYLEWYVEASTRDHHPKLPPREALNETLKLTEAVKHSGGERVAAEGAVLHLRHPTAPGTWPQTSSPAPSSLSLCPQLPLLRHLPLSPLPGTLAGPTSPAPPGLKLSYEPP